MARLHERIGLLPKSHRRCPSWELRYSPPIGEEAWIPWRDGQFAAQELRCYAEP